MTALSSPSLSEMTFFSYSVFNNADAFLERGEHLFYGGGSFRRIEGGIAQLVEHLPCKQGVIGSNPITSTNMGS